MGLGLYLKISQYKYKYYNMVHFKGGSASFWIISDWFSYLGKQEEKGKYKRERAGIVANNWKGFFPKKAGKGYNLA